MRKSVVCAASVAALAFGGVVAAAYADPPGCGALSVINVSSGGLMTATAEGSCNASQTRSLRVEIKHDESFAPDPLVAANTQTATSQSYYVQVSSCDHGNTATYYGRGYFTSYTTYHDSSHQKWHVC
ncbi:MAG: hypothetical protein ACR2IK_25445 [Chloroflexota bacterium]